MKSIIFDDDDDEVQPLMTRFGHPFAHRLLSPDVLTHQRKKPTQVTYPGYHELAYLHPNRFLPDPNVLSEIGLTNDSPFFLLRFNAFKAHHDVGVHGLSFDNKLKLVRFLEKHGRVLITTEKEIEPELKPYQLPVSPEKAHSLLYYATMLIGDSQTMTSEAAVLGTPSIRSNSFVGKISYLEEEQYKYGLTYGFQPTQSEEMFRKIFELISMPSLKAEWQRRRIRMLEDKIDVTAFFVWFVENWPGSMKTMKENPDYTLRFR